MKSKQGKELEEELDKKFKEIGIKPRVYHFRDVLPFNAITVVTDDEVWNWDGIAGYIHDYSRPCMKYLHNRATCLLQSLTSCDIYGVSICDKHDKFSRQEGRNWAKRRLLRHLKKVNLSMSVDAEANQRSMNKNMR